MKKAAILIACLVLLTPPVPAADAVTGDAVLRNVAQTYAALRSFRLVRSEDLHGAGGLFDGTVVVDYAPAPLGYGNGHYGTDLIESEPGNLRLVLTYATPVEVSSWKYPFFALSSGQSTILLVADAGNTWLYFSNLNQYIEYAAAPLLKQWSTRYRDVLRDGWDGSRGVEWREPESPFGEDDLAAYADLSARRGEATIGGEKTSYIGSEGVPCYVVWVAPKRQSWVVPKQQSRTLWVDKERFLVVRDEWEPFGGGVWSSQLDRADFGPQPETAFQFAAPAGAQRVNSFGPPKGLVQQAEVNLAHHLMGADLLRAIEGENAPDFTAQDLTAHTVRLRDLRGKVVVLDFYATWCKPCQQELAAVQKLHAELRGKEVAFLGIDEDEDRETVKNFLTKNGYTFPTLVDSGSALPAFYRTGWVPTVIVINRKGRVAAQYIGAGGEAQLRKALRAAGLNTTP